MPSCKDYLTCDDCLNVGKGSTFWGGEHRCEWSETPAEGNPHCKQAGTHGKGMHVAKRSNLGSLATHAERCRRAVRQATAHVARQFTKKARQEQSKADRELRAIQKQNEAAIAESKRLIQESKTDEQLLADLEAEIAAEDKEWAELEAVVEAEERGGADQGGYKRRKTRRRKHRRRKKKRRSTRKKKTKRRKTHRRTRRRR